MGELRGLLSEAAEEYNRYRAPEAEAEVLGVEGDRFMVRFTGSFCYTCGFYDYFDDYAFLLEDDYGVRVRIAEVREVEDGAVVSFELIDLAVEGLTLNP